MLEGNDGDLERMSDVRRKWIGVIPEYNSRVLMGEVGCGRAEREYCVKLGVLLNLCQRTMNERCADRTYNASKRGCFSLRLKYEFGE